jgi:hypothetical protein
MVQNRNDFGFEVWDPYPFHKIIPEGVTIIIVWFSIAMTLNPLNPNSRFSGTKQEWL